MSIYITQTTAARASLKLQLCIAPDKALFFFNQKVLIFFLFSHENIYCGYSLEVPHRGTSNEYLQYVFVKK